MSYCFHCNAPHEETDLIVRKICAACAADTTMGRMTFADWRFLFPGELTQPGDEYRGLDRTFIADFRLFPNGGSVVPILAHGMFRRRVRLAEDAKRFIDPTELSQSSDDTTPIYVEFPPKNCVCPEEGRIDLPFTAPAAKACKTCGRIWAALEDGQHPEVELTNPRFLEEAAKHNVDPCTCERVSVVPEGKVFPPEVVRTQIVAALGPLTTGVGDRGPSRIQVLKTKGMDERTFGPVRLQCMVCGQVWTEEAWLARNAKYPDLPGTHDRTLIRAALRQKGTTLTQVKALDRYTLKALQHRWRSRLKKGAEKGLGKEASDKVDAEIENALKLLKDRAMGKEKLDDLDPVAAADSTDIIDFIRHQLGAFELLFHDECTKARLLRQNVLNEWLVAHGGKPFFVVKPEDPEAEKPEEVYQRELARFDLYGRLMSKDIRSVDLRRIADREQYFSTHGDKTPKPIPSKPEEIAVVELASLLRPALVQALAPFGERADVEAMIPDVDPDQVVYAVGCLGGPELIAVKQALTISEHAATLALLAKMTEFVSPYEDSYSDVGQPDLSDLVEASTGTPGPKCWTPLQDAKNGFPEGRPVHILCPGDTVQAGDLWNDEGKLRAVQATIGLTIPGLQVLEAQGKGSQFAVRGTSIYCRPIRFSTVHDTIDDRDHKAEPPDPFREMRAYQRLEGKDPNKEGGTALDVSATAGPIPDKIVDPKELEKALRALYEAAGLQVTSFTVDLFHKIARLSLRLADGSTKNIAVALPPALIKAENDKDGTSDTFKGDR
jgi:hypothetical protein